MKWPRWTACLVAVLALLTACTAPTQPTPTPTTSVTASASSDINALPRDRIADGGLVRVPLAALPTHWNPWHSLGATTDAERVRGPLSQSAFTFDSAGRATANPAYLAEVHVTHEPTTRVTLTLNPNAVWNDGAAITASDWIATWKALGGDPAFTVTDDRGWRGVASVTQGSDAHHVVVEYAGVEPDWSRPLAAGPARADSVADAATFNAGWPTYQAGWFTGPFVLGHLDRTQGVVTLDRNPRWWGDQPKLDHVVFRTIQSQALSAAFGHNEFDWLDVSAAPDQLKRVRTSADTTVRVAPGTSGRLLRLDTSGVLVDKALRTALLRALDRSGVASADLPDVPVPTWSNHLLLTNQPGYVDQAVSTGLVHDRTAAAQALTQAGWPIVDGHRTKDGRPLTLTMTIPSTDAWARAEYAAIEASLADLGVTLQATTDPGDLVPVTVDIDAYPLAGVRAITEPTASDLVGRIAAETDQVRRADLAAQLGRLLWEQAASVPLHQSPQVVAVRNGLANLGAPGYATTAWQDVGWAR